MSRLEIFIKLKIYNFRLLLILFLFQLFLESLFYMLDTAVGEHLTTKHREAWTTLSTSFIRAYNKGRGDSSVGIFEQDPVPFKKYVSDDVFEEKQAEKGEDKEFGEGDVNAAKTIQRHFRGHHVRKRTKAVKKGTKVNLSIKGLLQESWGKLEGDELNHGLTILNRIFSQKPEIIDNYSFKDDKSKIAYFADFNGSYSDVPIRNWFLMFK